MAAGTGPFNTTLHHPPTDTMDWPQESVVASIPQIVTPNNSLRKQALMPARGLMFGRKATKENTVLKNSSFEKASLSWASQIHAFV